MLESKKVLGFAASAVLLAAACGGSEPPPVPPPAASAVPAPPPPPVASAAPAPEPPKAEAPKEEPKPAAPTPAVRFAEGISTPESVLYDEANDRYLVSNINGKPGDADNNGYIMALSPDGKVLDAKFIAGGEKKVKLDAPKGMAIVKGVLYVSDITVVRKFDLKTGAPKGDIAIPGATFLNDLASAPDGRVFVSDTGIKFGAEGPEPTGTDAVYVIDKAGKVKPLAKSKDLGGPNGVVWTEKGLLTVGMGSGELYRLDDKGARQDVSKMPDGMLDGVVVSGDSVLVSSWKASAVFKGTLGGKFEVLLPELKAPADIGFDTKRKRVLVPRFMDNAVEAYDLK